MKFVYILIRLKSGEIVSFNINMDRFEKKTHERGLQRSHDVIYFHSFGHNLMKSISKCYFF